MFKKKQKERTHIVLKCYYIALDLYTVDGLINGGTYIRVGLTSGMIFSLAYRLDYIRQGGFKTGLGGGGRFKMRFYDISSFDESAITPVIVTFCVITNLQNVGQDMETFGSIKIIFKTILLISQIWF